MYDIWRGEQKKNQNNVIAIINNIIVQQVTQAMFELLIFSNFVPFMIPVYNKNAATVFPTNRKGML